MIARLFGPDVRFGIEGNAQAPAAQVICPTGCLANVVSSPHAKNIPLRRRPKSNLQLRYPAPIRGAARDRHGRWERDAMDAAASGAIIARTNDVAADGEVVWSWRPDAGAKVAE